MTTDDPYLPMGCSLYGDIWKTNDEPEEDRVVYDERFEPREDL